MVVGPSIWTTEIVVVHLLEILVEILHVCHIDLMLGTSGTQAHFMSVIVKEILNMVTETECSSFT